MTTATKPFTCIDNDIIENMAEIDVYGFAVYAAIKNIATAKQAHVSLPTRPLPE